MNDQASSGRELYDKFAKPLEAEHPGEFVAVSRDGRVLFGRDLYELVKQASKDFGPDNHVFKVGDRVLGKGASQFSLPVHSSSDTDVEKARGPFRGRSVRRYWL